MNRFLLVICKDMITRDVLLSAIHVLICEAGLSAKEGLSIAEDMRKTFQDLLENG